MSTKPHTLFSAAEQGNSGTFMNNNLRATSIVVAIETLHHKTTTVYVYARTKIRHGWKQERKETKKPPSLRPIPKPKSRDSGPPRKPSPPQILL
jgi:hypothetical protein